MVHRIYTSRKDINNPEAQSLLQELRNISGLENLSRIAIYNRYDVQGLSDSQLDTCRYSVFAEAFTDQQY